MNKLVILLIVLVVLVYTKYYLKPNPIFQILQASITKVKPSLLFEKSPIVIEEPLVRLQDLLDSIFKYLYIMKRTFVATPANVLQQNKCRYLLLSSRNEDTTVQIAHPKHTRLIRSSSSQSSKQERTISLVDIKLQKNQCLVLPLHWWYKTPTENIQRIQLDDVLSILLGKL